MSIPRQAAATQVRLLASTALSMQTVMPHYPVSGKVSDNFKFTPLRMRMYGRWPDGLGHLLSLIHEPASNDGRMWALCPVTAWENPVSRLLFEEFHQGMIAATQMIGQTRPIQGISAFLYDHANPVIPGWKEFEILWSDPTSGERFVTATQILAEAIRLFRQLAAKHEGNLIRPKS